MHARVVRGVLAAQVVHEAMSEGVLYTQLSGRVHHNYFERGNPLARSVSDPPSGQNGDHLLTTVQLSSYANSLSLLSLYLPSAFTVSLSLALSPSPSAFTVSLSRSLSLSLCLHCLSHSLSLPLPLPSLSVTLSLSPPPSAFTVCHTLSLTYFSSIMHSLTQTHNLTFFKKNVCSLSH